MRGFTCLLSNLAGRSAVWMLFCSTNQSLYFCDPDLGYATGPHSLYWIGPCQVGLGSSPAVASYFESIPHSDPSDIAITIPSI